MQKTAKDVEVIFPLKLKMLNGKSSPLVISIKSQLTNI